MNDNALAQSLASLPPMVEPGSIGFWPPAPGWFLLAILILFAIASAIYYGLKFFRDRQLLRQAKKQLQRMRSQIEHLDTHDHKMRHQLLLELSKLLRVICLHHLKNDALASSSGTVWLKGLDAAARSKKPIFSSPNGEQLLVIYQNKELSNSALLTLLDLSKVWLEKLPGAEKSTLPSKPQLRQRLGL